MKWFNYKNIKKWGLPVIFLCIGVFIGFWFKKTEISDSPSPDIRLLHPENAKYNFINPLIGFELSDAQNFPELLDLKNKIQDFINKSVNGGRIKSAGVYLRLLKNGHWIGINENENFYPGSLLKVPLMTAYFKEEELNPIDIFSKKIYFAGHDANTNPAPEGKQPQILVPGQYYTVEELIRHMIIESDNDSKDALLNNIDLQFFKEAFNDTGLEIPDVPTYTISPKEYSFFFRRLYNATLLNRDSSEKALNLLTQTQFKEGLVAGVPAGTKLAHKFGERVSIEDNQIAENQLHDCGIIYYPSNHALLCIMTRGSSAEGLKNTIQGITKILSAEINNL